LEDLITVFKLLGIDWSTAKFFETTSFGIPYMIPSDYEEAATMDGANEWQVMRHIYLPLLKPSLINIFIIHYIWEISAFEIPYVLAGDTGGISGNMYTVGLFFFEFHKTQERSLCKYLGAPIADEFI
jgi:ABC-type sugar transport system permease subunit